MKVYLMYPNRDFDFAQQAPWNGPELTQDLQLDTVCKAMAAGDELYHDVARTALLSGLENGPDIIRYRQAVLRDCLKNPAVARTLYGLAVDAVDAGSRRSWGPSVAYPPSILSGRGRNTPDVPGHAREAPGRC